MKGATHSANAAFDPEKELVIVPALDRPSILANRTPSARPRHRSSEHSTLLAEQ